MKNCITFKETKDKVTFTITGAAFRNVQKMADALNATASYDGKHDNTVGTVLNNLILFPWGIDTKEGAKENWFSVLDGLEYTPEYRRTDFRKPVPKKWQALEARRKAKLAAFPIEFEEE